MLVTTSSIETRSVVVVMANAKSQDDQKDSSADKNLTTLVGCGFADEAQGVMIIIVDPDTCNKVRCDIFLRFK